MTSKIELTSKGWNEVTTKNITILKKGAQPLSNVTKWLENLKNKPQLGDTYKTNCSLCKRKWGEVPDTGNVNIVFTTDGNKILCDDCLSKFK